MSHTLWTLAAVGLGVAITAPSHPGASAAPKARAVLLDSTGAEVGTLEAELVGDGLRVRFKVHDVAPGEHGMHVHASDTCGSGSGPEAFADAGPHFDPLAASTHAGLNGAGHAGDLGNISVGADGKGKMDVVARDLTLAPGRASVMGKPVVLHTRSDNLTNTPENGGSNGRLACGVIQPA